MKAGFNTPFDPQIEFLLRKLDLPSERWDDIKQAAHDRAFIVAGAMKADLVSDLHTAVVAAARDGQGIEAFRKDFTRIVNRHGWTGWTGEGTPGGFAWRTKVIYQTNMSTSYAAGRWRQLTDPAMLAVRPYWQYKHADGVMHPRPLHLQWGTMRLTLRYDHPFWKTHYPPNGWGCHCYVVAVDGPAQGDAISPPEGWDVPLETTGAPAGIDHGWGYAPGASALRPLHEMVAEKLINLEAPIGAAMWESLGPALAMEQRLAVGELVDAAVERMRPVGEAALAHVVSPATAADLAERGVPLQSADVWLRDEDLIHALRDSKSGRGSALSPEVWRDLPALMLQAKPYIDTHDTALVYVFDLPGGKGKVLVRVNYADKLRIDGKRTRLTSNFIKTGGVVQAADIEGGTQYVELRI